MSASQIIAQVRSWLVTAIDLLLVVLVLAAVLRAYGVRLSIAIPGATELAYLAGAWWLTRK